jgi:hypothetical protein
MGIESPVPRPEFIQWTGDHKAKLKTRLQAHSPVFSSNSTFFETVRETPLALVSCCADLVKAMEDEHAPANLISEAKLFFANVKPASLSKSDRAGVNAVGVSLEKIKTLGDAFKVIEDAVKSGNLSRKVALRVLGSDSRNGLDELPKTPPIAIPLSWGGCLRGAYFLSMFGLEGAVAGCAIGAVLG